MTAAVEEAARAAWQAGRCEAAVTVLLEGYGQELLEYQIALARSDADGKEAYSRFAVRLWRALPSFRWETSARAWCYLLARHAVAEAMRTAAARRARQAVELTEAPAPALAAVPRTRTRSFLRTDARDALASARDALSPEERELLVLRIDRGLAWRDVARIMYDDADGPALERRSAALRKRFEALKARLRAAVRAA